jgi:hypothetical protein
MSKVTPENTQKLIFQAVVDADFRERLIASPIDAAREMQIELDNDDAEDVKRLAEDLRRFGGRQGHAGTDVNSWTLGILQIRKVPR